VRSSRENFSANTIGVPKAISTPVLKHFNTLRQRLNLHDQTFPYLSEGISPTTFIATDCNNVFVGIGCSKG
jgi:hypothetical protein